MTYDGLINTLRTYATETVGDGPEDCPVKQRQKATCREVFSTAADALETSSAIRKDTLAAALRMQHEAATAKNELEQTKRENEILRSELRRMFQLYVAAETRADTGVNTEED
jgi:hypothetical protein